MSQEKNSDTWVVYRMTIRHQEAGQNAVCHQSEWDQMERTQPGYHTLVRDGITTETEAEKLARGTSGDPKPRQPRPYS